jgi:hypothetical protein
MKPLVATLLGILLAGTSRAAEPAVVPDSGRWQGISPDGKHLAVLAEQPDEKLSSRADLDTGLVKIVDISAVGQSSSGAVRGISSTCHNFALGERAGARAEWSPDSRYFVITTVSNGGHSPWHFESYVYGTADQTLRYMDDAVGLVVRPDFRFDGPHDVRLNIATLASDGVDFDHPKQINFNLDAEFVRMKKTGLDPN